MLKLARIENKWMYLAESGEDRITANSIIITKDTLNNLYNKGAEGIELSDNASLTVCIGKPSNDGQSTTDVSPNYYVVYVTPTGTIKGTIKCLLIKGSTVTQLTLNDNMVGFTTTSPGTYKVIAYADNCSAEYSKSLDYLGTVYSE